MNRPSLFGEMNIAYMTDDHTDVVTDSLILARELGTKHYILKRVIKRLIDRGTFNADRKVAIKEYKDSKNRSQVKYQLTKEQTVRILILHPINEVDSCSIT